MTYSHVLGKETRNTMPRSIAPLLALGVMSSAPLLAASIAQSCYSLVSHPVSGRRSGGTGASVAPVNCSMSQSDREDDVCFMLCGLCTTPELAFALSDANAGQYCSGAYTVDPVADAPVVANMTTTALLVSLEIQGYLWDYPANISAAVLTYVRWAPRRDLQHLFADPYRFGDFLVEHARFGLSVWSWSSALGVPEDVFAAGVLPYAFVDEKRDVWWRWRPALYTLFRPLVEKANSTTQAMHILAEAIPAAQVRSMMGVSGLCNAAIPSGTLPCTAHGRAGVPERLGGGDRRRPARDVALGVLARHALPPAGERGRSGGRRRGTAQPRSPRAPAALQVAYFGASCTGTAIVLAAAAR